MAGYVSKYSFLFIIYIFISTNSTIFLINFFWLPNFLSELTSQKDYFMVNKENHQSN